LFAVLSSLRTMVTTGTLKKLASRGPTHSVAPSLLAIPQRTRSKGPVFKIPLARVKAVAKASAPPNARSESRIPRSAPRAMHSLTILSAGGGPMLMTVTADGAASLSWRAASRACLSSGFITSGTSQRIRVLVAGSMRTLQISLGSGTALTHTTMFIAASVQKVAGCQLRVAWQPQLFS